MAQELIIGKDTIPSDDMTADTVNSGIGFGEEATEKAVDRSTIANSAIGRESEKI